MFGARPHSFMQRPSEDKVAQAGYPQHLSHCGNTMIEVAHEKEDFSLVLGGPLYQLMLRSGLIDPPLGHLAWRIGVITGIAWLPLVLLTIFAGRFAGGVRVPLLYDFEVHTRLLFSLPLMILAELVVYGRMGFVRAEF